MKTIDKLQRQLVMQIQAEEDQAIFDAIDDIGRKCNTIGHPGYSMYRKDCDHPDCVAMYVTED